MEPVFSTTTSLKVLSLLAALALGACGGSTPVVDGGGGIGVTGTGTLTDPWTMPTENEASLTKTMDDYLADGGYWQFIFDSKTVSLAGTFGTAAVYNTVDDTWTLTINGVDSIVTGPDVYSNNSTCDWGDCIEMDIYDAGASVAQYGTFGNISVTNINRGSQDQAFFYTGLKTPATDMPGGSATYTGYFEGTSTAAMGYAVDSSVAMTADFGTGAFTFSSTGTVLDGSGDLGTYTLDSTSATITGNSYSGTMVGSLTLTGGATDSTYSGTIDGAFYGPAAEQTAGAVVVTNDSGELIQGGFWGATP